VSDRPINVLIVCTGNSARSILAESLINHWGRGRFRGYSAGSQPRGTVHPVALELLRQMKMPTEGLRSKSWDEFARPGAPEFDFIFTVCDNAANETCPAYPGQAMRAHWGVADPALETGSQTDQVAGIPRGIPRARKPRPDLHQPAARVAGSSQSAKAPG
jgi:arsenate reductase